MQAARRLAIWAVLVVLLTAVADAGTALASTQPAAALRTNEIADCADQANGPVNSTIALAVCTDFVADLVGVGKLLGLPALAPTGSSLTSPVQIVFSDQPSQLDPQNVFMETRYFSTGVNINIHPCRVLVFPRAYDGMSQSAQSVSPEIHVLLVHEAVHCYQNVVISFQEAGGANATTIPQWISEGSATYLATLYTGYPKSRGRRRFGAPTEVGGSASRTRTLTARSYDAVGWYSMVARATGNDRPRKFVAAWRAFVEGGDNNDAYIMALGGDAPAVEAAWAPSLLHHPAWGDAWDTPGIGVPAG